MKVILRYAKRLMLCLLASIMAVFVIAACVFGIRGYRMYKAAVKEKPVSEIAVSARNQKNFVKYEELPQIYIDAVISAEDKRFEKHCGIDIKAIGRAVWIDIVTMSFAEGGSTITQQIAKNQLFSQEKRLERKFAEVFAAFKLEKEYSKKELFEIYVNTIYFGSGYYGIYDAAYGFFGKEPSQLTDYEAVMLAALPNAPSVYSPGKNIELVEKRMSVVLERMIKCGRITEQKAGLILNKQVLGGGEYANG